MDFLINGCGSVLFVRSMLRSEAAFIPSDTSLCVPVCISLLRLKKRENVFILKFETCWDLNKCINFRNMFLCDIISKNKLFYSNSLRWLKTPVLNIFIQLEENEINMQNAAFNRRGRLIFQTLEVRWWILSLQSKQRNCDVVSSSVCLRNYKLQFNFCVKIAETNIKSC